MKFLYTILLCLLMICAKCQNLADNSKYFGKYSAKGLVVQIAQNNGSLVLIVPGAPFQELIPLEKNKFKTIAFGDEFFVFIEKNGQVEELVTERSGRTTKLKKISNLPDEINSGDDLLNLKKTTNHFSFLYSGIDSVSINGIAERLESSYKRILNDFKLESIPMTIVRVYPSLTSFHKGINSPNAPDNVLATAFGKNDFRMVSPNNAGADSSMLTKGVVHEFTHCVHLNIDYSPNNPRWLWEGVAMFESDWFLNPKEVDAIKSKHYPKLNKLDNGMEYMIGFVVIEAIKEIWGFETVINLIKKRGDIKSVVNLSDKEFENKIFDHIYKKYITP